MSDLGTGFGQRMTTIKTRGGPSIDHAMWFQQDIRADDWVLIDLEPIKAWGSRAACTTVRCATGTVRWEPRSTRSTCCSRARWRTRPRGCAGLLAELQAFEESG